MVDKPTRLLRSLRSSRRASASLSMKLEMLSIQEAIWASRKEVMVPSRSVERMASIFRRRVRLRSRVMRGSKRLAMLNNHVSNSWFARNINRKLDALSIRLDGLGLQILQHYILSFSKLVFRILHSFSTHLLNTQDSGALRLRTTPPWHISLLLLSQQEVVLDFAWHMRAETETRLVASTCFGFFYSELGNRRLPHLSHSGV
jgi:hypothetical protein